jgi:hypothetical protein
MNQTAKKLKANCKTNCYLWHQREQILVVNGLLAFGQFHESLVQKVGQIRRAVEPGRGVLSLFLTLIGRTPAPNQMLCGALPLRELKLETSFGKTTGDNAAALEHQFRFGAHKKGSYLQHPACSGQPDA